MNSCDRKLFVPFAPFRSGYKRVLGQREYRVSASATVIVCQRLVRNRLGISTYGFLGTDRARDEVKETSWYRCYQQIRWQPWISVFPYNV